jgi:DNA polymerase-1
MKPPWLLLDVSGLCYQSFFAFGDLSHKGIETAVVYGVFRSVFDLQETHATSRLVWCFDRGSWGRKKLYPEYKAKRQEELSEEEAEARRNLKRQIYRLRTKYLPDLGFRNILWRDGYEADDVIASVCESLPQGEEAIIVSSDSDLLQLLSPGRVSIWVPGRYGRLVTAESFGKQWGISPSQWADVKAIAGCTSDNVRGVFRVGEVTAAKFLTGVLKDSTKTFKSIVAGNDIWRRNLPLVQLPFPGVGTFKLLKDEMDQKAWNRLVNELGFESMRGRDR